MTTLYPVKYIFVHHTAVSYKSNPDQYLATAENHKMRFNMLSSLGSYIGYNYEIAADGTVRQFRQEGEETAAVISFNKQSVSICLDGNFDIEEPTAAQQLALTRLIINVISRHSVIIENVLPHRCSYDLLHVSREKDCYGSNMDDTWAQDLIIHYKGTDLGSSKDISQNEC